jgi:hypothetical protein
MNYLATTVSKLINDARMGLSWTGSSNSKQEWQFTVISDLETLGKIHAIIATDPRFVAELHSQPTRDYHRLIVRWTNQEHSALGSAFSPTERVFIKGDLASGDPRILEYVDALEAVIQEFIPMYSLLPDYIRIDALKRKLDAINWLREEQE